MSHAFLTDRLDRLPILILNPHNRCNCRCLMCEIWKRDKSEDFSATDLRAQLAAIRALNVEAVVLTGGEPLMSAGLFDLCRAIQAEGIGITLLSSGLLLQRYAREIVAHTNEVIVSLDGPPDIHNAIRNIPRAFELLAAGVAALRTHDPAFRVAARCTVQRRNCGALLETVQAALDVGLNSISFLAADTLSDAFDRTFPILAPVELSPRETEVLEEQIAALESMGECGRFIAESPEKMRRIVRHFRGDHVAPICNAPWHSTVVETDGTVRPCFFHAPIGRLDANNDLASVINSAEAIEFRRQLDVPTNEICRRCVCSLNRR